MRNITVLFILFCAVFVLSTCSDDSPTEPVNNSSPGLTITPRDNVEAELAALWLSGEIVAPQKLYEQIDHDLNAIRSQWKDSIPEVNIQFYPYWRPSIINMSFDGSTYSLIKQGLYHDWDSLNTFYRLDTIIFSTSGYNFLKLGFTGNLNSMVLVDKYAGLPGLVHVYTMIPVGDQPILLIYQSDTGLKYFFRNAWGDCPAGCIYSDIYYFEVHGDDAVLIDSYLYGWYNSDLPAWTDTVITAFQHYFEYNQWPPFPGDGLPKINPLNRIKP